MEYLLCVLVIFLYDVPGVLAVLCSEKRFSYGYDYFTCTYGCCGTTYNRYCCSSSYNYHSTSYLSTGASAAIGICVVCFFIAVVIAAICYKKKYHGRVLRAGTVGPHPINTVHVTHTTTTVAGPTLQPYPMYPPPAYPAPQMQTRPSAPIHVAPTQPGYVPPPPAYSGPSQPYGIPPPSYNQAENIPSGKY